MDRQELRDKIMAAINGIIKDEPEVADANLHDVLAAKMRARINGETEDGTSSTAAPTEPTEVTPTVDVPAAESAVAPTEELPGA